MDGTSTTSLIGLLKFLYPSLIGSALAVWYKRNDIKWKEKTLDEKIFYSFVGIAAIVVGVSIGLALGNSLIIYFGLVEYWYCFGVYMFSSLSSLKLLDAIVKNSDDILSTVFNGLKDVVTTFFETITSRWKKK
ncbi:putative holin [Acinetobacter phage Phab24]|nr:putative holin [Acinetobacter phage Phab24]